MRAAGGGGVLEVDDVVGRIARALDAAGARGSTLTIATSDNGPYKNRAEQLLGGSYGPFDRGGKGTVYEGGHRVWALAHWPGAIAPARVARALASSMDVMPTLASLAGVRLPRDRSYDGRDLSAVLFDGERHHHASLLCFGRGPGNSAARIGRWKVLAPGGDNAEACARPPPAPDARGPFLSRGRR